MITLTHKAVANNNNSKDLTKYMVDAPTKIIPPNHHYNNSIVYSGTTVHFLQATSACINRKLTRSLLPVALL